MSTTVQGSQRSHISEEEAFYTHCRAAYLAVFRSSLSNITSKEHLCQVLQQAGRNPSQKTLSKYWTPRTTKLNFDDFCEILKTEKPTNECELLKAFKKLDPTGDGYILHSHLFKVLTSQGEKLTSGEMNEIFLLPAVNKGDRFDYVEFCRLQTSTAQRCQASAVERLEADTKQKQQNFGNQIDTTVTSPLLQPNPPLPEPTQKVELDTLSKKVDVRPSSRPSSARSRRSSSAAISARTSSSRLQEPKGFQSWQCTRVKGCFYMEEDGEIVSLQYRLHVPQNSTVFITIQPLNLSQVEEKPSSWMNVDTTLFLVMGNETKEDLNLVCFTELKDKEKFGWKGELNAGSYCLLPFTTGCRLRKSRKPVTKTAQLVQRDESGELALTREFRAVLSDIFEIIDVDGNGLLSLEEYNFFEQRTSGEQCDEDAWAICKENFDTKRNELTRHGFMELNLMEANDREGDPRDLWVTLESMGYNQALEMVEACPFVISVYSQEYKPKVQPVSLESCHKLLNSVLCKSIVTKGEGRPIKGNESVINYTYRTDFRVSCVISNKCNHTVTVQVNNEQSRNCTNSRGMSVFAVEVPARTELVSQHVMPINEKQEMIYSCVESIISPLPKQN